MRPIIAVALLCLLPAFTQGQEITLPATMKAQPGFVVVRPETKGTIVRWHVPVVFGVSKAPKELVSDPKVLILLVDSQVKVKTLEIMAWTSIKNVPTEAAKCVLYFGELPNPGPDPGPKPEPKPLSELAKKLKASYGGDAATLAKLVSFYKQAVVEAKVAGPEIKTVAQFYTIMAEAARLMLTDGAEDPLRKAIAAYLNSKLPTSPTAAFAPAKETFVTELTNIAQALESLQ